MKPEEIERAKILSSRTCSKEMFDRIKRCLTNVNADFFLGNSEKISIPGGETEDFVFHHLPLEFLDIDIGVVSELSDGKIVLFPNTIGKMFESEPSSAELKIICFWIINREVWFHNKGEKKHVTSLLHITSPEARAAFAMGMKG